MNKVTVKFLNSSGELFSKDFETDNEENISEYASENNLFVSSIIKKKSSLESQQNYFIFKRVASKQILLFTWQLSVMLNSGAQLPESLNIIKSKMKNKIFKTIISDILYKIENGFLFSNALDEYSDIFSETYRESIRAGESAGKLPSALNKLSQYIENKQVLTNKLKSILTYPFILLSVAVSGILFLIMYVFPKFMKIFKSFGLKSGNINFLLKLNEILNTYAIPAIIIFFSVIIISSLFLLIFKRSYLSYIILKIPIIGDLITKINISYFAQTLEILLENGIPLVEAVKMSATTLRNKFLSTEILKITPKLENGISLYLSLNNIKLFSDIALHMIYIGEKSGQLKEMLNKINNYFNKEVEFTLSELLLILEPAILLILGGLVGIIAVSIFLPINEFILSIH
jgi:type IV pilus assembly protein PilC